MKIKIFDTHEELSREAKNIIVREIDRKKDLLLCAATGSSPTKTYNLLAGEYRENPVLFNQLKVIKLDEWGGIPLDHPDTCETYLRKNLLGPLNLPENRYTGFNSNPKNPEEECSRINQLLEKEGPIDLCILGLGMNGHLAFNEPADFLQPHCHIAELTKKSQEHVMTSGMLNKPTFGLTLGMADIFTSGTILMLISGSQKKDIVKEFLSKKITTKVPASFLWLHPNVFCLVEKNAIENDDLF